MPPADTPEATPSSSVGDLLSREIDGAEMVYVSAGSFEMGSQDGESNEAPVHTVSLDGFWLDHTEVSVAQFRTFVEATGHRTSSEDGGRPSAWLDNDGVWQVGAGADWEHPAGSASQTQDNDPVVQVSWTDAAAYCAWAGARLPTEAEWEYAARGPDANVYPWGDDFDGTRLNYCDAGCPLPDPEEASDDGHRLVAPVGSYPGGESWCGALDLAGNVWEWVADRIDDGYYASSAAHDPQGPDMGDWRATRGGSWSDGPGSVRSARRGRDFPDVRNNILGFRCAMDG